MNNEFFKGVKQWELERNGEKGKIPVFYYDVTSLNAVYTACSLSVRKLLPLPDMHPVEFSYGRCLVAITAFEYRETDIGPYNEVSVAFPITFKRPQIPFLTALFKMLRHHMTAYVWQLPVTTEIARRGGVEMYGYPKFLADIVIEKDKQWISCDLKENGQDIFQLKGKVLPTQTGKTIRCSTYSVCDGIPLKANVFINPVAFAETRNKNVTSLTLGVHPIAQALKTIQLSAEPVVYQYMAQNQAILFAGHNLMDS
ncbi:MAG: hypothetical protein C0403_04545 [Desulfobacterium sp.]|nr:hypothetical protein [Desulfobacterium sp.]